MNHSFWVGRQFWRGTLQSASDEWELRTPKGEITLLIQGVKRGEEEGVSEEELHERLTELFQTGCSPTQVEGQRGGKEIQDDWMYTHVRNVCITCDLRNLVVMRHALFCSLMYAWTDYEIMQCKRNMCLYEIYVKHMLAIFHTGLILNMDCHRVRHHMFIAYHGSGAVKSHFGHIRPLLITFDCIRTHLK